MASQEIFPLAQRLQALIPPGLRRWTSEPTDATVHDHLADDFLLACDEVIGEVGEEANRYGIVMGDEDETCKILAHGFDLSRSRSEPEFFRDRWRHTIKAQFVMAEAVYVLRFIG